MNYFSIFHVIKETIFFFSQIASIQYDTFSFQSSVLTDKEPDGGVRWSQAKCFLSMPSMVSPRL